MTISLVNPATWAFGDKLTAAQMNGVQNRLVTSLDKTVQGDSLAGRIVCEGDGRIIPTARTMPNSDVTHEYIEGRLVRIPSTISANRNYTLDHANAVDRDRVFVYLDEGTSRLVSIYDEGDLDTPILEMHGVNPKMPAWAEFEFRSGAWRLAHRASTQRYAVIDAVYNGNDFTSLANSTSYVGHLSSGTLNPVVTGDYVEVEAAGYMESTTSVVGYAAIFQSATNTMLRETKVLHAAADTSSTPFVILAKYDATVGDVTAGSVDFDVRIKKAADSFSNPVFSLTSIRARLIRP